MVARACPECGAPNSEFNLRCAACEAPLPPISGAEPLAPADSGSGGRPPGSRLGRYLLLERLGRGSMGTVWLAEEGAGGRRVALKSVQVRTAALLPTLRREIRALERLRHPGIVRILDSGLWDGEPWYAMELVEGATLRSWTQELEAEAQTAGEPWWTRSLDGSTSAASTLARGALAPSIRAAGVRLEAEDPVAWGGPGSPPGP
jgi:protein kinase-like protein